MWCFKARTHLLSGARFGILMPGVRGFKGRSRVSQSPCFGPEGIVRIPAPVRGRTDEGPGSELNPACVCLSLVRSRPGEREKGGGGGKGFRP